MTSGQSINKSATIAIVFDLDDTLVPDSTTQFLKAKGIDVGDFWKNRFKSLVARGWEPPLAYLTLILEETKPGGKLEGLTNAELEEFGRSLVLFPGLPEFFDHMKTTVKEALPYAETKFWVISGGLEPIIKGCCISEKLDGYWACRLGSEGDDLAKPVRCIKRAISFTEKTRFIFHINKGQYPAEVDAQPGIVNKDMRFEDRPIPLHNIIYVGDGYTDIPCFSLVQQGGGVPIAIEDKTKSPTVKQETIRDIFFAKRTFGVYSPDYTDSSDLCSAIRNAVAGMCSFIVSRRTLP